MKALSYGGFNIEKDEINNIYNELQNILNENFELDDDSVINILRGIIKNYSIKDNKLCINSYQQQYTAKRCPIRWKYFYLTMQKHNLIDEIMNIWALIWMN